MTNGDMLRQMTDEELAGVLSGQCACCGYQYESCGTDFSLCDRGVLKWIKQEVSVLEWLEQDD